MLLSATKNRISTTISEIMQLYESASKETMFRLIKLIEEIIQLTLLKLLNFKLYLIIISTVTGGQVTALDGYVLDIFVFLTSSWIIAFSLFSLMQLEALGERHFPQ